MRREYRDAKALDTMSQVCAQYYAPRGAESWWRGAASAAPPFLCPLLFFLTFFRKGLCMKSVRSAGGFEF